MINSDGKEQRMPLEALRPIIEKPKKKEQEDGSMKDRTELYAALVKEAEAATAGGHTYTRFQMLYVLDKLGAELNRDTVDLIEKLYADGFVNE